MPRRAGTAPRPAPGCSGSAAKPGRACAKVRRRRIRWRNRPSCCGIPGASARAAGSGAWRGWSTGNRPATRALLDSPPADLFDLRLRGERDAAFARLFVDGHPQAPGAPYGYRHYLQRLAEGRPAAGLALEDGAWERWAQSVLTAFDAFRLLCALRRGPWGVEGLNQRVAAELLRLGLIEADHGWYEGRPVLVTRNDYSLGLMNGDIGIALRLPERNDDGSLRFALRVAFPRNDGSGGVRFVLPSRLVEVDTVFAMTVHKSQGSEFAHTALVLPDALNPVLTKELVYTGITRARDWFSLVESLPGVFEEAVRRKVRRLSGLMLHLRPEREEQPPHAPGEQTELPF